MLHCAKRNNDYLCQRDQPKDILEICRACEQHQSPSCRMMAEGLIVMVTRPTCRTLSFIPVSGNHTLQLPSVIHPTSPVLTMCCIPKNPDVSKPTTIVPSHYYQLSANYWNDISIHLSWNTLCAITH